MGGDWYLVGRVALALGLGYAIGWERALRGHAAGDRTFALLSIGAAGFATVIVESGNADAVSRAVQGVAAGVGFIGAAVTWRREDGSANTGAANAATAATARAATKGLTTAAAVWAVVAIGLLCGTGKLLLATAIAAMVLFLLEMRFLPYLRELDPRRFRDRYFED
jgi:putative Mg2+ transporter-C (MgtC) family protein